VIRNLAMLLKPGGNLQWDELEPYKMMAKNAYPGREVDRTGFDEMRKIMDDQNLKWIVNLPQALKENGFETAEAHLYHDRMPIAKAQMDFMLMTWEEFADSLARSRSREAGNACHSWFNS
jgi:hypothetical protein